MGLPPAGPPRRYVPALRRRLLSRLATSDTYERLVRALPPIATAARRRALRYVAGETLDDALAVARTLHARGLRAAIDFFGEQVRDAAEAERAVDGYLELARRLSEAPPTASVALDLSHVGQDVSAEFCLRQLERIVDALPAGRGLDVGAEDSGRIDASHQILVALARRGVPVEATLQANLRRSADDWPRLVEAGSASGSQGRVRRAGASGPSLRAGHRRCLPPARPLAPRGGGTRDAGYPRRGASRRPARRARPDGRGDAARGPARGPRAAARAGRDAPALRALRARLVPLLDAAGGGVAGRRLSHHAGSAARRRLTEARPAARLSDQWWEHKIC